MSESWWLIMIKVNRILKKSILVIVAILVVLFAYLYFFTEVRYRFARYHNYIDAVIIVDQTQYNMKGIKVDYIYENNSVLESNFFDDYSIDKEVSRKGNNVKFKKGIYGENIFEFVIPKSCLKDFGKDIVIRFGHFNTNWWHIINYQVDVEINNLTKDNANITLKQKVSYISDGAEERIFENKESKEVTLNDSKVSIYTGP